jgi:hypothetical protein
MCAWCDKPYGDGEKSADGLVTHGICAECARVFAGFESGSLTEFLNAYADPILCVDPYCRVLTANDAACSALGHARSAIGDLLFGQLVLCPWALRDDGCGSHEHCMACAVRRVVGDTFSTRAGVERQPAYVERIGADGSTRHVRLAISSECQADVVLIRVDEMEAG